MTKLKSAPAEAPSAVEAAALVVQLRADIAATKTQIETAESNRDANALTLTDPEFEAEVLATERNKRSLLRLTVQLTSGRSTACRGKGPRGSKPGDAPCMRLASAPRRKSSGLPKSTPSAPQR